MAISMDTLTVARSSDLPPRILIYGPEKIGKTSLAAEFPNPAFLRIESGPPEGVELPGWDINDYATLLNAFQFFGEADHPFQTLVIDNLSSLESLIIWPEVVRSAPPNKNGSLPKSLDDIPFGKGPGLAIPVWDEVLACLNAIRATRKMSIVLVGHSVIRDFADPDTQTYNRYDVALQDSDKVSAAARVKREVDLIALIKSDVATLKEDDSSRRDRQIAQGGRQRYIHTEGGPAFVAGGRYKLPPKILYLPGRGFYELAKGISALHEFLPEPAPKTEPKKAA